MFGPVLRGQLVILRPPQLDEAEQITRWFADLEVTYGLRIRFPPSPEHEQNWLRERAEDPGCVIWGIEHEGVLVGSTGIHLIDWANGFGTTGTVIAEKSLWGRGLGSEVMRLRTEYAFAQLPLRKLKSEYIAGNDASWKAQRKCGYREVGRHRKEFFRNGEWRDAIATEVLREEWLETVQRAP
jgi:RimJ/RimL family protein N-acetyltransferase